MYRGFASEDEYFDARDEARRDEWAENATECPYCGELWDEGYHRATRMQPAEVDHPECPRCGMAPDEAEEALAAIENGEPEHARQYGTVLIRHTDDPRNEPLYWADTRLGRLKADSWRDIRRKVRMAERMTDEPTSAPTVLIARES
jgi:hypothetical protein